MKKIIYKRFESLEEPTIVLSTRSYEHLGSLSNVDPSSITYKKNLNAANEFSFKIYKTMDEKEERLWDKVVDLKLIWVKEVNEYFEIKVNVNDSNDVVKSITGTSLCEAELGQTMLYNVEINTESDIARSDYTVTKFYDPDTPDGSLLHRVLGKLPNYHIKHVDSSLANLQRSFSINGTSIYDFLTGECAEQFNCLFQFDSASRSISVHDLYTNCLHCGYRGEYADVCPECHETDLSYFGEDTTIYVDKEHLTDNVTFETDTSGVKNCFRLEAGDDLMTATVRSLIQNGGGNIWYFSKEDKDDMPEALSQKIDAYQQLYDSCTKDYQIVLEELYDSIDQILYHTSSMMPTRGHDEVTAATEANKLTNAPLSPLGLSALNASTSAATVEGALKNYAKIYVKSGYVKLEVDKSKFQYEGKDSDGFHYGTWRGNFKVTNYSDKEDVATTGDITVTVHDNYESFLKQKIEMLIASKDDEDVSVFDVLKIEMPDKSMDAEEAEAFKAAKLNEFKNALEEYSLNRLQSFYDAIQSVLEIMVEADQASESANFYFDMYLPYYERLQACQAEIDKRQATIKQLRDIYNEREAKKNEIQSKLNFENFLGEELYHIFCSYRREDTYSNQNYISDGLNNTELFERAKEFLETAKKELYKSGERKHSISTDLNNILLIPAFEPLLDKFELGNWIRVRADETVYRLRLISYTISFSDLGKIQIEFSDVTKTMDGMSDMGSILSTAQSMSTSYSYVSKQASNGKDAKEKLENWVENGLALTKMKIVDNADNQNITWDSHGVLLREYQPITDDYNDKQLKFINRGIYATDDNWKTAKVGIGDFTYYDPESGQMKEDYGVIADTLVGNLILSEKVGVYSTDNSIVLDRNGLVITTDATKKGVNNAALTLRRKTVDENGQEHVEPMMYIDGNGNLVMTGTVHIQSGVDNAAETMQELCDMSRFEEKIATVVHNESQKISGTIDEKYSSVMTTVSNQLNNYQKDLNQYLNYDEDGLTLGAKGSPFKTVIDNRSMAFKQGETTISYINNEQLYINSAVINDALKFGKFFFSPRKSGGVSLSWIDG